MVRSLIIWVFMSLGIARSHLSTMLTTPTTIDFEESRTLADFRRLFYFKPHHGCSNPIFRWQKNPIYVCWLKTLDAGLVLSMQ
jgi:hypothetical protein